MQKLYIANTTRQNFRFNYRLPEMAEHSFVNIASGCQELLPHELSGVHVVESVLTQLHRFGAVEVSDIGERIKGFSGLTYSLSKPVKVDRIEQGAAAVVSSAEDRSVSEVLKGVKRADIRARENAGTDKEHRVARDIEVEIIEQGDPRKPSSDPIRTKIIVTPGVREDEKVRRG